MAKENNHPIVPDQHRPHNDKENTSTVPPAVDPTRPPQLNHDNATSHNVCPCGNVERDHFPSDHCLNIIYEDDHLIEVGDFGLIPISLIHRTLAKHSRCTCHCGILPDSDDYPFRNTPAFSSSASSFGSPTDSMIVEMGSSDHSMVSSVMSLRSSSHDSFVFDVAPAVFGQERLLQHMPLLFNPLPLTADVVAYQYPLELSISSLDGSDRDG